MYRFSRCGYSRYRYSTHNATRDDKARRRLLRARHQANCTGQWEHRIFLLRDRTSRKAWKMWMALVPFCHQVSSPGAGGSSKVAVVEK